MAEHILHRVASGDRDAFERCVDAYGKLVWSLALRHSASREDAEDAVQEIFLDLWKSAARFDAALASEATFVATIARRRLIDRFRKVRRAPLPAPLPEALEDTRPSHHDLLEISAEAALAGRALDALREDQRRVVRLAVEQGLSHSEIAERTGLPIGTVKTYVRRGLIRVREILQGVRSSR